MTEKDNVYAVYHPGLIAQLALSIFTSQENKIRTVMDCNYLLKVI